MCRLTMTWLYVAGGTNMVQSEQIYLTSISNLYSHILNIVEYFSHHSVGQQKPWLPGDQGEANFLDNFLILFNNMI
jgi:hypothetical protein